MSESDGSSGVRVQHTVVFQEAMRHGRGDSGVAVDAELSDEILCMYGVWLLS